MKEDQSESKYIHDINNALTGIVGIVSLLKDSIDEIECNEKDFMKRNIDLLYMATGKITSVLGEFKTYLKNKGDLE